MRRPGALLVLLLVLTGCTGEEAAPPERSTPRMLVSSADDAAVRLQEREPSTAAGERVEVDAGDAGQVWQGTGASLTDASVDLLEGRSDLVDLLVDPGSERGARLDWLRLPLTATDYSSEDWAWDWSEADGATPAPQAERALGLLRDEILPVAPDLRLVATAWTAPPEMKEPAEWHGGSLRDDAVASYGVMVVDQARWLLDEGYPLAAMTLGNEPGLTGDYPTMLMSDEQLAELADQVGPRLDDLGVELWGLDHNWSDRGRVDASPTSYDAVAFHCYEGTPEEAAGLPVPWLVTECTGTTDDAVDTLAWDADVLLDRAFDAGSTGLFLWNPVLPPGAAGRGGCPDCRGLLTADPDPVAEPEYYVLAHLARAARPGDRVLPVTGPADLPVVAFGSDDGAVSVLGYNPTDRERVITLGDSGYRLGPHELFTWEEAP